MELAHSINHLVGSWPQEAILFISLESILAIIQLPTMKWIMVFALVDCVDRGFVSSAGCTVGIDSMPRCEK